MVDKRWWSLLVGVVLAFPVACGGDDDDDDGDANPDPGRPDQTGAVCAVADDCYPDLADGAEIQGTVMCLDRVDDGYCTHSCTADADCCAADGECKTDISQVCSPFESTGQMMCFLSCEGSDIKDAADDQEYCQKNSGNEFICRSSGGGQDNRKICVPGDCGVGEACSEDADCNGGLTCLTGLKGGYCGKADCTTNADCPADSSCVKHSDDKNYCFRNCAVNSDCSFCRPSDVAATCRDDATLVEGSGSVCVPPA